MAWVSRIETERQRQVLIAIVMGLLLALAVAAAAWLTAQRNPSLESERAGDFTLMRPGEWRRVNSEIEPEALLRELRTWQEHGGAKRRIGLLEFRHDEPLPPTAAMEWVMGRGDNRDGRYGSRATVQSETMRGMLAERSGVLHDGEPVSQLTAVMTLDGRRHAVLVLERQGELRAVDWRLMVQMAGSLSDTRYEKVESAQLALDGEMELRLPGVLSAMQPTAEDLGGGSLEDGLRGDLLLVPSQTRGFYLLEPRTLRLGAPKAGEAAEGPTGDAEVEAGVVELSPPAPTGVSAEDAELVTALLRRYMQVSGEQPEPRSVRPLKLGRRKGYALHLPNENTGSRSTLWAVQVASDRVMVLQLTAAPNSFREARSAAEQFLSTVRPHRGLG